jgi:hypothetical protein
MSVFVSDCHPELEKPKLDDNTIRSKIITVPGRLIHSGRAWTLKLPTKYVFKEQIETMIESINAIK